MLEKWKNVVFKRKVFRILLTDLSKAFDCISQQLLVAESHAYDLSLLTSKMMSNCLLNCKMRTNVGSSCTTWQETLRRSLRFCFRTTFTQHCLVYLFNYFISYVDGSIPSYLAIGNSTEENLFELKKNSGKLFAWLVNIQMKGNYGNCGLLLSAPKDTNIQGSGATIQGSDCEKLLGAHFDKN